MSFQKAAQDFVHNGFCFIPLPDTDIPEQVRESFDALFSALIPSEEASIFRPGEQEPDIGLIRKRKTSGGDEKWYFHVAHDIAEWSTTDAVQLLLPQREAVCELLRCKREVEQQMLHFSSSLEEVLNLPAGRLTSEVTRCSQRSLKYSVNTLRGLYYPDSDIQTGAKAHIDRCLVTGHFGDEGGSLEAEVDNTWCTVSPPEGQMVVFAGAKMLWLTEGVHGPLRHRSLTVPGEDRRARVLFCQADIGYYPDKAEDIVDEFYRRKSVAA